jgi:hypothetical protein
VRGHAARVEDASRNGSIDGLFFGFYRLMPHNIGFFFFARSLG